MVKHPKAPPRFVPTLTEVVPDPIELPVQPAVLAAQAPVPVAALLPAALPPGLEERLVHCIMQRVDVSLDQRLRDAIATVVQEQTRSVLPRLREEVESVVRQVVGEAVADELAEHSMATEIRSQVSGVPATPPG